LNTFDATMGKQQKQSIIMPSNGTDVSECDRSHSGMVVATSGVGINEETTTIIGMDSNVDDRENVKDKNGAYKRTELMHDANESKREDIAVAGTGNIGDGVLPVLLPIRHERDPMFIHSSSDIDARTLVVKRRTRTLMDPLIVWLFAVAAFLAAVVWAALRWMKYVNAASGVLLFDERRKSIATKRRERGHFPAVCRRRRYWANSSALVLFALVHVVCCGIDGSWAVFTPVDTAALKAAVGSCSGAETGDPANCTGGCLGETPDGSCPTFAASNDATGNPYGVMGDWGVSKVTSLKESTPTHVPFSSLFFPIGFCSL
jgi:hypothetical protein